MAAPAEILVCDDHDVMRKVVMKVLEQDGHRTREAANVEEAQEAIAEHPPDLVVLDLRLGPDPGTDLIDWLRGDPQLASIPVLLMSGESPSRQEGWVEAVGAAGFLLKPFDLTEFGDTVRALLAGRDGAPGAG